ncbi:MAG: SIS domain-containing protein, partial [Anaerolineaceae bacterium]|nr:SIS domain-containing protein [Anaerolineaceae bacterium]
GGTLFLCGNGGSMSDAQHISGELLKAFNRPRPLSERIKTRLATQPGGEDLAGNLEGGLPAVVLGINTVLSSAVDNDYQARSVAAAQELNSLQRPGDVLIGISTSGKAYNVYQAAVVARALGTTTILFTGEKDSRLSAYCDIVVRAPASRTDLIQEWHIKLYHCLCDMLERDFFGG